MTEKVYIWAETASKAPISVGSMLAFGSLKSVVEHLVALFQKRPTTWHTTFEEWLSPAYGGGPKVYEFDVDSLKPGKRLSGKSLWNAISSSEELRPILAEQMLLEVGK